MGLKTMNRALDQGLVLDLDFREGVGSVVHDKSFGCNNCTLVNAPVWVAGAGVTFDGVNQYGIDAVTSVAFNNVSLTIALKVTPHAVATAWARYVMLGGGRLYIMQNVASGVTLQYWNGATNQACDANVVLVDETEYVIVFTLDASGADAVVTVYVNGERTNRETKTGQHLVVTKQYILAANSAVPANPSNVTLKKVRVYRNRLLSEQEIRQLMESWT